MSTNMQLPAEMWVVTRERTRAGKPPLKISPTGYDYSGDKPVWAKVASPRFVGDKLYLLSECFATPAEAAAQLDILIDREIQWEQSKLNKLRTKLNLARNAAKQLP